MTAIVRKCLVLAALTPLLIVHRLAFWIDEFLFPAVRDTKIKDPLFIVGLPRSGTTFLHRLVSAQAKFTSMPLWELIFAPALCEKYLVHGLYVADRAIGNPAEKLLSCLVFKLGASNQAHPTSLMEAEEDFLGLLPFDGCFLRVFLWPYSEYSWRLALMNDQSGADLQQKLLKRYRGLLARHLCFRGTLRTVVSKNPSFTAWMQGLSVEFPDARFLALRRTPYECVPSQLSSIRCGLATFGHRADDPRIVARFVDLLAHYWARIEDAQRVFAADRFQLMEYAALTADPFQSVITSLEGLGYVPTGQDQLKLREDCERGLRYRSSHRYSLAEFGLSPAMIDTAFGRYLPLEDCADACRSIVLPDADGRAGLLDTKTEGATCK